MHGIPFANIRLFAGHSLRSSSFNPTHTPTSIQGPKERNASPNSKSMLSWRSSNTSAARSTHHGKCHAVTATADGGSAACQLQEQQQHRQPQQQRQHEGNVQEHVALWERMLAETGTTLGRSSSNTGSIPSSSASPPPASPSPSPSRPPPVSLHEFSLEDLRRATHGFSPSCMVSSEWDAAVYSGCTCAAELAHGDDASAPLPSWAPGAVQLVKSGQCRFMQGLGAGGKGVVSHRDVLQQQKQQSMAAASQQRKEALMEEWAQQQQQTQKPLHLFGGCVRVKRWHYCLPRDAATSRYPNWREDFVVRIPHGGSVGPHCWGREPRGGRESGRERGREGISE